MAPELPRVDWEPAGLDDAQALVQLRIEAMRESLERIGRFDPQRARDRFLSTFSAEHTWHLAVDGLRVGFLVLRPYQHELLLDHLYIHPDHQGRRIGAAVLHEVFARADRLASRVRVGALRESDSNRFYQRHGFVQVEQGDWDTHYIRLPVGAK